MAIMADDDILKGKKILVVDDEPDILETLEELLDKCDIETAATFESASDLLKSKVYDAAILDIMGVDGFSLLEIAIARGIPALMLTAHALSEDTLKQSAEMCASYYVPKEEIHKIEIFVADVIEAAEKKKSPWIKCFQRLGSFYDERFGGTNWREKEKEFWESRIKSFE